MRFVAGRGALWRRDWPGRYGGASAERRRYGGAFAGRGAAKCGKEGGALRGGGGPARGNPCWVTSVGDPALGNKGVLDASGLYLNQLRGFCFVVPCQSSK